MINVAIIGYGVVGSGVAEVLTKNFESISKNAGKDIVIKYILDLKDFPGNPLEDKFIKDFNIILNDKDIRVVAEVMGGIKPAYQFTKSLLESGKSVVTSNKELVSIFGADLLKTAKENGVSYLFEASVGGGIPIIRPLHQCLAANEINTITGILNGTTNYILTKMIKEGMTFEAALKKAQELGYAEGDPSADVLGKDACRKISILASLAFGSHIDPETVQTQGITDISLDDVKLAGTLGYVIKLLGKTAREDNNKISIYVSPFLIKKEHPLAGVEDVFNAIMVSGNAIGDCMFYGRGAGKLPTASAVVADIIDCCQNPISPRQIIWGDVEEGKILPIENVYFDYYLRTDINSKSEVVNSLPSDTVFVTDVEIAGNYSVIVKNIKEGDMIRASELLGNKLLSKIRVL